MSPRVEPPERVRWWTWPVRIVVIAVGCFALAMVFVIAMTEFEKLLNGLGK